MSCKKQDDVGTLAMNCLCAHSSLSNHACEETGEHT